jgi:hypothetical protein
VNNDLFGDLIEEKEPEVAVVNIPVEIVKYPAEKCAHCEKDNGIFNEANACCRERHYRMFVRVSLSNADGYLKQIRNTRSMEEFEFLDSIPKILNRKIR